MAPKYTKTIICLANSRKPGGRCVAGKEIASSEIGDWIRPVSERPSGELWVDERCYENGDDPRLLDVISIPMIEPRSHDFQSENHLIDDRYYWSKQRVASWKELKSALDKVSGSLWGNASSGYNGLNDRVAGATAKELDGSLKLVEVKDLKIVVAVEGAEFGNAKRKVRGRFTLKGSQYLLSVTDPIVERQYWARPNGEYEVGRAILCTSLGEPHKRFAYKLIAGVFLKP